VAQDAIKAAEAKVEQINSMISELTLLSPCEGKVQYQPAHAGDSVTAGAPIVALVDLTDVHMTVFLRTVDAGKLGIGDEARLILDAAPDDVVPAAVSFVASELQAASLATSAESMPLRGLLRLGFLWLYGPEGGFGLRRLGAAEGQWRPPGRGRPGPL